VDPKPVSSSTHHANGDRQKKTSLANRFRIAGLTIGFAAYGVGTITSLLPFATSAGCLISSNLL
jgi:hypothetical protein